MWRTRRCDQILGQPRIRSAQHSHFPVGPGLCRRPFDGVVSVSIRPPRVIPVWMEPALRGKGSTHVLPHDHVAPPGIVFACGCVEVHDPIPQSVAYPPRQHRVLPLHLRPVHVRPQDRAVPHRNRHVLFDQDLVSGFRHHSGHICLPVITPECRSACPTGVDTESAC